jgi:D-alanyl-D-alanine carboxypeptidase
MQTIKLRFRRRRGTVAALAVGAAALLATAFLTHPVVNAAEDRTCPDHAATERALHDYVATADTAGAALRIVDPECGSWTAAAGLADVTTERPLDADERIRIGSTTKTFTAVVAMQLVDEGRLDLEASVDDYLPGRIAENGYDGRDMTVRDLLQHTAGMRSHDDAFSLEDMDPWRFRTFTDEELVDIALTLPAPESEWSYANTGFVLVGMIVERITGQPIGEEITDRVITPLGLEDTYWPGEQMQLTGPHPRGYWPVEGAPAADVTEFSPTWAGAAGALVSTLSDQQRFFAALLGGELVSDDSLDRMQTIVDASEEGLWRGASYGLGLIATELEGCEGVYWGHGGTFPGYTTRGGTTEDGRSVQLFVNDNPSTEAERTGLTDLVDTAMCEGRER